VVLPIRARLTIWYSGILLITLLAFGVATYLTFQAALQSSVDVDLQARLEVLERVMRREIPHSTRARLRHELQEGVELRPGGDMLQISDSDKVWVFQSETMQGLGLPAPAATHTAEVATLMLRGIPVRVRTAAVGVQGQLYHVQLATPLGAPYEALKRLLRVMLGFIPLLVIVAAAGGYWLSARALSPVDRIIQVSRKIGHNNLSQRLMVPRTGDELQRLSETLNEMIQRLEAAFQRVTQFTADASHELRAPVAFIRATAEVALLHPREAESYRASLSGVLEEAERITKLIDDLLILARADSGAAQLSLIPTDVREPLQQAGHRVLASAAEKNIRLRFDLPCLPLIVLGDELTLRRLFIILIDNAIKYTPDGGGVEVRLNTVNDHAIVTVHDSGIGIPEEEQGRIFERFYRSDKARLRESGGAGLGLSIARWIADVHRAQIHVHSTVGVGSDFTVRLARAS
jgi:heavy metal sensor kinase